MANRRAVEASEKQETQPYREAASFRPEGYTFYVHCIGGEVLEVAPADAVRVTDTELVFLLGEAVVMRLPRAAVYFAARKEIPVPVQF